MGTSIGKPFIQCFDNEYQQSYQTLKNQFSVPIEQFTSQTSCKFIIFFSTGVQDNIIINSLQQNNCSFQIFSQIENLRAYKDDTKVNILIIHCTDSQSGNITLPNYSIYQSIDLIATNEINTSEKQLQILKKKYSYRFGQIIKQSPSSIRKYLKAKNSYKSLYFCHQDVALINRANLVFYLYINGKKEHSADRFFDYLNTKGQEEKKLAKQLRKQQNNSKQVGRILIQQIIKNNPIIIQIISMLTKTKNPGIMPHFAWAYTCLSKFIKIQGYYQKQQNKNKQFYIVETLSDSEIQLLEKSKGQCFMFSTFKLAYCNLEDAQNKKKQNKANVIFIVHIPPHIKDFLKQVDFGFYVHQGKVIFNVQNFFTLDQINNKNEFNIIYGSLAHEYSHRQRQERYLTLFSKDNTLLMLNLWDYYLYSSLFINTQIDLIFALQMYHKYKEIVDLNLTQTERGFNIFGIQYSQNISPIMQKKNTISTAQKLGDCQLATGNSQKAIQLYRTAIYPQQRGIIKLLDLFNRTLQNDKYQQTLKSSKQIQSIEISRINNNFLPIEISNFKIIMLIKQNKIKQAQRKIIDMNKLMIDEFGKFTRQISFKELSRSTFPLYNLLLETQIILATGKNIQLETQINQAIARQDQQRQRKLKTEQKTFQIAHQNRKKEHAENLSIFAGTHIYWLP